MPNTGKDTFENSLKKLSEIADKLESGETSLDESILLFENGMKISKELNEILDKAQQRIISLTSAESEGKTDD